MPIVPNLLERLTLLRMNLAPGVLLDFLGAQAFRAACAAHRLGVFDALRGGPLTAVDVAARIEADERGTTVLLEALEALGYVRKRNGHYANTAMTAKWLPVLGDGIRFFEATVRDEWAHLEESIRRGRPPITGYQWLDQDPGRWADFEAGMLAIARMSAPEVVARVKLPAKARQLLDVGGGHGYWAIAFCRRHPGLSATVFDQAQAVPAAERTITVEKMTDRVAVRTGDFWRDDLGRGYDALLLFNIIHAYPAEQNVALLNRANAALAAGGRVVILDQVPTDGASPVARAVARLQGLNMFNAEAGQAYAADEIDRWLASAGFTNVRRIRLLRSPGFGVAMGTKPHPS
jgi:hypothetical protein